DRRTGRRANRLPTGYAPAYLSGWYPQQLLSMATLSVPAPAPAPAPSPTAPATSGSGSLRRFLELDLLDNRYPVLHGLRVFGVVSVVQWHVSQTLVLDQKLPVGNTWAA